jgi:hypothetical protein
VWESADEGETWMEIPMVNLPGPDPSVVPDGEGGWTMFYKAFSRDVMMVPGMPGMSPG